jgi:hypothetical protein
MNLVERTKIVEAITPQAGAAITGDYISMKNANHVTVLVHVNQANAATMAITLEQATAVAGTNSKAIGKEVPIYLVADAAVSDSFVRQTDAVAYTTSDTTKHKIVAFEVDAEDLDIAGGFDCLTVKTAASNAANITSAVYVCGKLRYGAGKSLIVD